MNKSGEFMSDSKSKFIHINNTDIKQLDDDGKPLNGIRIYADDFDNGMKTILRFRNGFLDGDLFNNSGELVLQKPAVESEGHQEYWRENKLHRDNGEPAVYSNGFKDKEWWEYGEKISKNKPE